MPTHGPAALLVRRMYKRRLRGQFSQVAVKLHSHRMSVCYWFTWHRYCFTLGYSCGPAAAQPVKAAVLMVVVVLVSNNGNGIYFLQSWELLLSLLSACSLTVLCGFWVLVYPGYKVSDPFSFLDQLLTFFLTLLPPGSLSLGGSDGDVPFIEDTLCVLEMLKLHSSLRFQGCYINVILYLYTSHCAKNC